MLNFLELISIWHSNGKKAGLNQHNSDPQEITINIQYK